MNEWLLTDEEIWKIRDESNNRCRDIAKAQAKNLVEWGDEVCLKHKVPTFGARVRRECYICMQALRREVGLEVKDDSRNDN